MKNEPFFSANGNGATSNLVLLTFQMAQQIYGLPVTEVVRIIEMVTITPLADLPRAIQGIINVRGKIISVMDLRRRLHLAEQAYRLHTPIILVDLSQGQIMGLVVDQVLDVVSVPRGATETVEEIIPTDLVPEIRERAAYLAGVAKVNRQIIPVLKVQALLTPAEHAQLTQALSGQPQFTPLHY